MKLKYGADERAQKLKYHIQTSGRSLHAQEISFNDIRTTLQALYAIYDNCNSLHTNAYDEAITTPTEESVRRALAQGVGSGVCAGLGPVGRRFASLDRRSYQNGAPKLTMRIVISHPKNCRVEG